MAVRSSQVVIASLSATNLAHVLASQIVVSAVSITRSPPLRATQVALDAIAVAAVHARASAITLEILVWIHEVPMPALYPTLPGLTYSVIKRPKFFTGIAKSTAGREVRVGYAANPLWEWDLTYNYLPDMPTDSAATASDLKELVGFYLSQVGALQSFKFLDPDDNQVSGQVLGTTDGLTTAWVLTRTYGGTSGTGSEPIGWLNTTLAFTAYLDGVVQDPSSYDLLTTIGTLQQIRFHATPAAGKVVKVDMHYYYNVRFAADTYDFEKFMDKLWSTQTVTLASQRA